MSLNVNNVTLAGHLTRDPELRILASDNHVCSFGLAINRRFKGSDGQLKEEVTFIDCEAWGRTAELVGQYLVKGSAAYVEGRLKLDSWQDKEGKNRTRIKVVVESVQFIGPPKGKASGDQAATSPQASGGAAATSPARTSPAGRSATDDEPPF